jgi:PAS domain S-box-containing protein
MKTESSENRRRRLPEIVALEKSIREMADALPLLTWMCDAEGRATFLSRYWYEFSGRSFDSGLERDWLDLIHPDDRQYVLAQVRAAIETQSYPPFEFRVRRMDQEYRWMLDEASPRFAPDGTFAGYVGICIDITERKRAEESRARLAAIVRSAEEAIMSIGLDDYAIQTWNPAAEKLFGYSAEEMVGSSALRTTPPDRVDEFAANLAKAGRGEPILRYETVRVRKDGTPIFVSLTLAAIKDAAGTPIAVSAIATDLTPLKQAEAARRNSEEWLRMAQEAAGVGIWDWSVPDRKSAGSPQHFHHYGLPPRDAPMKDTEWLALVHPDDRERMRAYYAQLWREDENLEAEFRVVWPDGTLHWLLCKARTAIRNTAGEDVRVVGISLEVTRLKIAEQARREAEERYANLFQTMDQGVIYFDGEGKVLSANASAEKILGMTSEEMRAPFPSEAAPGLNALRTGTESHNLVLNIANSRTGARRWVSIDTLPQFRPGATKPYQVYSIFQDITGRFEADARLRASEERFRLLVEHGLEVVEILNPDGTIRYASPSVERVFGHRPESLIGMHALEYVHADDRAAVQQVEKGLLSAPGTTVSVQFRIRHQDGTWHHAEGVATNCLNVKGLDGILVNLRDITARKRFEEELINSRQQLRQLARSIESAREQERIRISREIHDELGQMLSALKLDLEGLALKHRPRDAARRKDLTERVASLVSNIDVSLNTVRRIAAELRPSILTDLGLSSALQWQVQEFESRTGIRCKCHGLLEGLHLEAEPSLAIFRIFQEILTNVVRHANAKSVEIGASVRDGWLALKIADNGKGLDPQHLADARSLGILGMRERANLLGGTVEFSARRGGGTVVTVRIPCQ